MVDFFNFGFYTVDSNYLKYLYGIDKEVYYSNNYYSNTKPFLGIIIGINNYKYFIPISSAKPKHSKWKNSSDEHFLIYEIIKNSYNVKNQVYKKFSGSSKLYIISILDLKKMIPVPNDCYKEINFNTLTDQKYKALILKEYNFCLSIKEKIIKKVKKIYFKQQKTGIVKVTYCNFSKLEIAMNKWEKNKI